MLTVDRDSLDLLPLLSEQIHDCCFDIEQVTYNEATGCWKLPLGESRKGPYHDRTLTVSGVDEYSCRDTEKVGIYVLNDVAVNMQEHTVTIDGIPCLDIKLVVREDFTVSLD